MTVMRDLFLGIAATVMMVLLVLISLNRVMPQFEDLRVVKPKPGIQCAIVSRLAHTSIDCWKVEQP